MLPLFILSILPLIMCADNMEVHLNPGCHNCSTDDQLVYAKSHVSGETYHFVWSSLKNADPAFLLVQSSNESSAHIDWDRLLLGQSQSLIFDEVQNDIGFVIRDILLFNDTEKAGTFNESDPHVVKQLQRKSDARSTLESNSTADALFVFTEDEVSNLTVKVKLSARIHRSRFVDLPHLLMSPASFHVQVTVEGDPLLNYTNCRLIMDMELFHRKIADEVAVVTETTIDDEYSPGVFSISTARITATPESFVQWKAVGYNKADRIIAHTVDVKTFVAKSNTTSDTSKVMKGYSLRDDFEISSVRFSFGAAKDSFYSEYQYTDFSFVVGLGVPERDGLSLLVQIIIWVGFGVPVLALIAASVYMTVKRIRGRVSSQPLIED